jgi:hypothetical protein
VVDPSPELVVNPGAAGIVNIWEAGNHLNLRVKARAGGEPTGQLG